MRLSKFFLVGIIAFFNTSCAFNTGGFDWKNIYSFNFENIQFEKTTKNQMQKLCPDFVPIESDNQYFLISSKPKKDFALTRLGFDNQNKLEWIEFILKEEKPLDDFLSIYGAPISIDTQYDQDFDYYEYDDFKLCTDKKGEKVYSMVFYKTPEIPEQIRRIDKIFPTLNNLNISPNLRPGITLETEFTNSFPNIIADSVYEERRVYTIYENLSKNYKKVELIFSNGILRFINLIPKDITLKAITDIYGQPKDIGSNGNFKFYEYANFIVTLDEKNNIISIGIFDSWKNYATNK